MSANELLNVQLVLLNVWLNLEVPDLESCNNDLLLPSPSLSFQLLLSSPRSHLSPPSYLPLTPQHQSPRPLLLRFVLHGKAVSLMTRHRNYLYSENYVEYSPPSTDYNCEIVC